MRITRRDTKTKGKRKTHRRTNKRRVYKNRQRMGGMKVDELLFISGNKGKIDELSAILSPIRVVTTDIDLPEIQTTDVEEVVKDKVMTASNEANGPLFVEDTGLYITSKPMNGFPGALIKFYFKKLGNNGICEKNGGDEAYVESVIGYNDGSSIKMFKGVVNGTIAKRPQEGPYGFGWDAIFIPKENNPKQLSFAQMPPSMKNTLSMRKQAAEKFKAYLSQ